MRWTEPIWGPTPDPPKWTPDDGVEFGGWIAVTASDEVRTAMQAAVDAVIRFELAVNEYRRSNRPTAPQDPSKNPGADVQRAREDTIAAIEKAQTVMRDELADL